MPGCLRKPPWLMTRLRDDDAVMRMRRLLASHALHTVCESAMCPNVGKCFPKGTATFMILGGVCTRSCRFCAVGKGRPEPLDKEEPRRVAEAAKALALRHVVVTSVTRDDLPDGGASHFARTIAEVRSLLPEATIEVLIPDFQGSEPALRRVIESAPDIVGHNVETVPRLYPLVRPQAVYARSLKVLRQAAEAGMRTKSGLMLGLGEEREETLQVLRDLRGVGLAMVTLGQYLRPSLAHLEVQRYVRPEEFQELGEMAMQMGFAYVASAPLVRSSFNAEEALAGLRKPGHRTDASAL